MVEGLLYPPPDDPTLPHRAAQICEEGGEQTVHRHVRNVHLKSGGVCVFGWGGGLSTVPSPPCSACVITVERRQVGALTAACTLIDGELLTAAGSCFQASSVV